SPNGRPPDTGLHPVRCRAIRRAIGMGGVHLAREAERSLAHWQCSPLPLPPSGRSRIQRWSLSSASPHLQAAPLLGHRLGDAGVRRAPTLPAVLARPLTMHAAVPPIHHG